MNTLITGSAYVESLSTVESDGVYRAAFLELALQLATPRAVLFDFGCGPGLDARVYANHGHRVYAFDVDPGMCGYFRASCAQDIAASRIDLIECRYEEFLASSTGALPPVDLVTANFAPLNLVAEPAALFTRFASMLKPTGLVLASVLNPFHRGDLRYSWWWRGLPRLLAQGSFAVEGAQAPIRRWLPARLEREAGDAFVLDAIYSPPANGPGSPRRLRTGSLADWPAFTAPRFLFLLWRRRCARP